MPFHNRSTIRLASMWLLSMATHVSCMNVSTPGYRCDPAGVCTRESICGDGWRAPEEECDDGNTLSGDGCSEACRDQAAPELGIVFPSPWCTTNAPKVTVCGIATDEHGSGVQNVMVNDVLATFESEQEEQWRAEIELASGSINEAWAFSEDRSGNSIEDTVGVEISYVPVIAPLSPTDVAIWGQDPRRALLVDDELDALVSIDLQDGTHRIVSGDHQGSGVRFKRPAVVAADPAASRAFVVDVEHDAVFTIDLQTGDRSVLGGASDGEDGRLALVAPRDMAVDPARDRLLVIDAEHDALIAVDLRSGQRTVVLTSESAGTSPHARLHLQDAGAAEGSIHIKKADQPPEPPEPPRPPEPPPPADPCDSAPSLHEPVAITVEGDQAFIIDACDRMLTMDLAADEIREVCADLPAGVVAIPREHDVLLFDPGSRRVSSIELPGCRIGDERVLSLDTSDALGLVAPGSVAVDGALNRVVFMDTHFRELFLIDLRDDALTALRGGSTGAGPRLWAPRGLAVDWDQNLAYVVDKHVDALFRVDLQNGRRTIIGDMASCRAEQPLAGPLGIALAPGGKDVLIIDEQAALVAMDRESGDCRILSDQQHGSGPSFAGPRDIAAMTDRNVAYIADWDLDALFEIDLDTGDRAVVSDQAHGSGPSIEGLLGVALDEEGRHAYVTLQEGGAVSKIDLSTGQRTVVSDAARGSGPFLHAPIDVALDRSAKGDEILVLDLGISGILRVDAASGDRTGASGALIGSGPLLTDVASMAVHARRDLALVVDAHLNALVLVDLITGDRVIVSR
jgi:cysteine-rich repeat protein